MPATRSSTQAIPEATAIPKHIAIIMDGNGRWAKKRFMPRVAGHVKGVERVKDVIKHCIELGVEQLSLFAFSSENWRRPEDEVSNLMELFVMALEREVGKMHKNGIRLRIIGDLSRFNSRLQELIQAGEALTANNQRLTVNVAANYGGRWDILSAANAWIKEHPGEQLNEADLAARLSLGDTPEPDLFIRTGGEERISNFLLWQLAYTELYFTDTLWPDFNAKALDRAIVSYQKRERRFGRTSEQLVQS
jgi:undecaprenyl diphosphate synthase